ncbi:MAG: CAF17-like 4Fe-4S cluster assembly/insertion protein YgfZ [Solirubrobacteraceae bacterium]
MATIDASPHAEQYRALTERCGVVDRSERGKLALTGADAAEFLNGQVTNEVVALAPGKGCYAAFLTHKGKMLGDLRILVAEDELLLDTERVALQALFDMIRRFKVGYQVELHKRTLESALLSLVGPAANDVVERALAAGEAEQQTPGGEEHDHLVARIGDARVRLIQTDTGVDVLCDASDAARVSEGLQFAGAQPVGEDAAEVVRVERGRPRYGVDIDDSTIPQEAGLNERAVSFTKGCYVGQETVARLYYKGKPNRLLRGVRLSEPVDAGAPLLLGEREVGTLTSSVLSPALGPIGLALVRVQAEPGSTLSVGSHAATAVVTELPFAAQ